MFQSSDVSSFMKILISEYYSGEMIYFSDLSCKACKNALQSDDLNAVDDDINSKLAILARDRFDRIPLHNLGLSSRPTQQQLNQAFLNELRLGIHNWKRTGIDVRKHITEIFNY